jgi:hypothetical protein
LIRAFGLETRDDPLVSARKHIEQADYWTEITIQAAQSTKKSKSLASLEHTIQHNLNRAFKILTTAEPHSEEVKLLKKDYRRTERKFRRIQIVSS